MNRLPLLQNIFDQPESLRAVIDHAGTESSRSALEGAVTLLKGCRGRVVITGMGASFFASMAAHYKLESCGVRTLYMESSELLHSLPEALHEGDVVVLVSRSGGSVEVVSLLPLLRAKGIASIGITNVPDSALANKTDVSLLLHSYSDQMVAVQTYAATVFILNLLAECVAGRLLSQLLDEALNTIGLLGTLVETAADHAARWDKFLSEAAPLYLIGRNSALITVMEGVLLFHETAKASAVGMSSAQFRHGPVEVVSRGFRTVVIASHQGTRHLDIALANDLVAMGSEVLWLGPGNTMQDAGLSAHILRLDEWPQNVPAWLAPLFDIVPLQFAAYRLALLRHILPGSFRYTPLVTTSEVGFASVSPVG